MCIFEDPTHNIFHGWTGPLGISVTVKKSLLAMKTLLTLRAAKKLAMETWLLAMKISNEIWPGASGVNLP